MPTNGTHKITYDSKEHKKVLELITRRKRYSTDKTRSRAERWKQDDDKYQAYVPAQDIDNPNPNNDDYVRIEIPYSYAAIMSAHTYLTGVFMGRDPVYQYEGRHGEPEESRTAVEAIMEYQRKVGRHSPHIYGWLLDTCRRGVGIVGYHWVEEKEVVRRIDEEPISVFGFAVSGKVRKVERVLEIPGYVGTRLYNVRAQDMYPDPRKAMVDFQLGEFFGVRDRLSWNAIVKGYNDGMYFNLEQLKRDNKGGSGAYESDGYSVDEQAGEKNIYPERGQFSSIETQLDMRHFDVDTWVIELIPKDWMLGSSDKPEKWMFMVANDKIIFGCRPLGEFHNKFPFGVLEYEIDPHQFFNRGMSELLEPMQNVISWLVNSHFFNIRKSMNDMFLFDPSRVYAADLANPEPGKLLRMRPSAYGTDVRTAVTQFQVQDVTQQHLRDTMTMTEIGQQVSGLNSNMMGQLDPRGRKTATEARVASTAGAGRLKTVAEYMAEYGFSPFLEMLLQSTQQHYDMERSYKIAGDLIARAGSNPLVDVSPEDIVGSFSFSPIDSESPTDKFAMAALWRDIINDASQNPMLAQSYNIPDMFAWVAQLAGLKNIKRFKVDFVPDEQIAQQQQAGNVVPLGGQNAGPTIPGGAGGPVPGAAARTGAGGGAVPSQPAQVPGMGATL